MGDPETPPIMMRLKSDLVALVEAAVNGRLDEVEAEGDPAPHSRWCWPPPVTPTPRRRGAVIGPLPAAAEDLHVFHAGTATQDGRTVVSGGRVLAVTALGAACAWRRNAL